MADRGPEDALRDIDRRLSTDDFPQQDWEVLYRMRLQVERDLLAARAACGTAGRSRAPRDHADATRLGKTGTSPERTDRSRVTGLVAAVAIGLTAVDVALALVERRSDGRFGRRR